MNVDVEIFEGLELLKLRPLDCRKKVVLKLVFFVITVADSCSALLRKLSLGSGTNVFVEEYQKVPF